MKTNFKANLYGLLKKDSRVWDEEKKELNETLLKDLIDKLDEKLIELLLNDKETNKKFFVRVKDVYVLKQNELKFFIDENKLDNSYTQYQNKIGLKAGNKLLSERDEVVLDWPFKDCVLEGGMTKEDQKRNEIFFNEILAKDEIDRLFDPKALVNWKRYTTKGEEKIKELKRDKDGIIRENLIIKGNNLLALHSLKKQFAGKVKLIYIDPPYNTGTDNFGYNDNYNHSTWLTFMKNRLKIAHELLGKNGILVVQINNIEHAYLKILLDEIFGNRNFYTCINWQRTPEITFLGQGQSKIIDITEYLLIYAKDKNSVNLNKTKKKILSNEKVMNQYPLCVQLNKPKYIKKETNPRTGDPIEFYLYENAQIKNIKGKVTKKFYLDNLNNIFRFARVNPDNSFLYFLMTKVNPNEVYAVKYRATSGKRAGKIIECIFYKKNQLWPLRNNAFIENKNIFRSSDMSNWWTNDEISSTKIANEGNVSLRRGKKPEELIKRIIEISTSDDNDLIMDFFLGSGTTAAVAHKMNRHYIGIEQIDYGNNDSVNRLKNIISGEQTGISKTVNWQGGGDFVYVELAKWNEEAKEKILNAKSLTELEKLFDELYERYFLNYNVKTKEFKEKILKEEGFKNLSLDEQKNLFVEMLDMNQMYVSFSERADKKYNLSEKDIKLSEEFYLAK
jgi:adenine-specific DNA-methyltransferase